MHALVVDDSRAMRSILTRILGEAGFETISQAGDGQEALDVLAGHVVAGLAAARDRLGTVFVKGQGVAVEWIKSSRVNDLGGDRAGGLGPR